MNLIKVSVGCLNLTPLDWEGNLAIIFRAISEARAQGACVLCLPELCITGYGCEDTFLSRGVRELAKEYLLKAVEATEGMIVTLGLPIEFSENIYDCVAFVVDKKIIGIQPKRNLAKEGVYYEPRWFEPWVGEISKEISQLNVLIGDNKVPFGNLVFSNGETRIGFEICEDAWVKNRPGIELEKNSVNLILNPSASHFAFKKLETRKRLVVDGSKDFSCAYLYANLQGNDAGRVIFDGGGLIAENGKLIAQGKRFSYSDFSITTAVIDVGEFRKINTKNEYKEISFNFKLKKETSRLPEVSIETWEKSADLKKEEFTRAVSLGLFDYMRKSRSRGFTVSLSGGADSASVSCLVKISLLLAEKELGIDGLKSRLAYIDTIKDLDSVDEITKALLICVYQGTKNSSDTTRSAASAVAKTLNATFYNCDVGEIVGDYTSLVQKLIGYELNWNEHDIALQNIQARVRAPLVWFIANLTGALLLATSNRSEAAVGYTTMDGDTCGGLSPISGIDKAFLLSWLSWMEKHGADELGAIPELSVITAQQPTAELRPRDEKGENQTDEKDLMPYVVLDAIERLAIRDRLQPTEVFKQISVQFSNYSQDEIKNWVEKFFILWARNQWKRERYAPSFHLDDENLDPKTWCRFPILSGGYVEELRRLRKLV